MTQSRQMGVKARKFLEVFEERSSPLLSAWLTECGLGIQVQASNPPLGRESLSANRAHRGGNSQEGGTLRPDLSPWLHIIALAM